MLNTDRLCLGCMNDNGGEQICSICGYDAAQKNPEYCLPAKFWLNNRYLIGKFLERNGEGLSYIGWDNLDDCVVRIREYFPEEAAVRNPDRTVGIPSDRRLTFNEGLMDFLELNRQLADTKLPSVVPCLAAFEENGTAYAVFPVISGITLLDFLSRNGGSLKWEQARPLLLPLMDTLSALHEQGIVHCGISPETILVGRDGKLRLNDFSIRKLRDRASDLPAQLYSGYAAVEQYGVEELEMDAKTDIYGLSATLFRVLIGTAPPDAEARLRQDSLTVPSHFAEELPRPVLVALANGLQVLPSRRTESMEAFKNELVYGETAEVVTRREIAAEKAGKPKKEKKTSSGKYIVISALITALLIVGIAAILAFTVFRGILFGNGDDKQGNESEFVAPPSVASIGTYDSDAAESTKLYAVPDLLGKYYSQIADNIENEEYEKFQFVIKGKEFSNKYAKGTICSQSVAAGTEAERDTRVEVVISLGSQEIKIANVVGLSEDAAKLELLKQGFLYENIEVVDKYDENAKPGAVLEQSPEYGTKTNTEITVRIYRNTYEEPTDTLPEDTDRTE